MSLTAEARARAIEAPRRSFSEKFHEKPTRKAAIDLMCQQCMGGPENQGWRRLIQACSAGPESASPCPLWAFRPYKG